MRLIDISPLIKAQDICEDMECRDCELEVRDCESMMDLLMKMPTIDAVPVQDGILKARKGDYVTYRIDYLLDHLAQEISLLEGYRRGRKEE